MRKKARAAWSELTRAVTDAKTGLAVARHALARATSPDAPSFVADRRFSWAKSLLEANEQRISALPGVVGYGLGLRDGAPVVTVYVEQMPKGRTKIALSRPLRSTKRSLDLEIVRFGKGLKRQLRASASLGESDLNSKGTLGTFARTASGHTVAITAMHVVSNTGSELDFDDEPLAVVSPSPRDGNLARVIGGAVKGTMRGIDAVRIDLGPDVSPDWTIPKIGPILGWRPTTFPGDHGIPVKAFGAQSGRMLGHIRNPKITLPKYDLVHAIVVEMDTAPGDSGCALVDNQNLVLGFLVGHGRGMPENLRLFCAAGPVLRFLKCDIPSTGS